jgi:hypothetical protein
VWSLLEPMFRCGAAWFSLLVAANVVPSPLIPSTLKVEATRSYETSVLTRPARQHIAFNNIQNLVSDQTAAPATEIMDSSDNCNI